MLAGPVRLFPTLLLVVVCACVWIGVLINEKGKQLHKEGDTTLYMPTSLLSNPKLQNEQKIHPTNSEQPWHTERAYFVRHSRTQRKHCMTILRPWLFFKWHTYYKEVSWAPIKPLRLPLQSAKEGWNSSPASGGTQPFCSSDTDMNICKKMPHFMSGGSHSHHLLRNSTHSPF